MPSREQRVEVWEAANQARARLVDAGWEEGVELDEAVADSDEVARAQRAVQSRPEVAERHLSRARTWMRELLNRGE